MRSSRICESCDVLLGNVGNGAGISAQTCVAELREGGRDAKFKLVPANPQRR